MSAPSSSAPEESKMEIHHPKPFHGWREFLKEYAIIVLGVLTALAAEQTAEALHHHVQVVEMTEKLRAEAVENIEIYDFDISNLNAALGAVDSAINALSAVPAGPASAPLSLPESVITLSPGDSAWLAIQYSSLLPIMPKGTIANYWKIERSNENLRATALDFVGTYRRAQSAIQAYKVSGSVSGASQSLRETLLLRLTDAENSGKHYISLALACKALNQKALAGEELNLALARRMLK
jgi:hypothetical protein